MSKFLITGGAGYIGSTTASRLLRKGHDVIVVDDLSRGHAHNVEPHRLRVLNLCQTADLERLLEAERVDAVLHFAAYIAVGESTKVPELYFWNNVGGSLSLLNAMMKTGVSRLVFSSTAAVYGNPDRTPIAEDQPYQPVSPYGESKVMVEKILGWMDQFRGIRSIPLRYFNACGADPDSGFGEEHDPETHLIPLLFKAIRTGNPVTIFGNDYDTKDGTCIRDYIHVSDLADAHISALDHLIAGGHSDAFNIGTGSGLTVMEVLRAVEEVTGHKVPHVLGPRRAGDPPALVANSNKLRKVLGWKPVRSDIHTIVADAWAFEQKRATAPLPSRLG
jgi:UDP-glucose-4-epimerase GalE